MPALPTLPASADEDTRTMYVNALDQVLKSLENRQQTNWFDVAAGFLNPGQTGSFGEGLGKAAGAVGAGIQRQQALEPSIAMLRADVAGKKYEVQSQAEALQMLANAVGSNPVQLQEELTTGNVSPQTQDQLKNIDPKAYLAIAAKNPKVGEIVSKYADITDKQINTQLKEKEFTSGEKAKNFTQQLETLKIAQAATELQLKVLQAGNDQAARKRAEAEFVDKVGPAAAKTYGIDISATEPLPTAPDTSVLKPTIVPPGTPAPAPAVKPAAPVSAAPVPTAPMPAAPVVNAGQSPLQMLQTRLAVEKKRLDAAQVANNQDAATESMRNIVSLQKEIDKRSATGQAAPPPASMPVASLPAPVATPVATPVAAPAPAPVQAPATSLAPSQQRALEQKKQELNIQTQAEAEKSALLASTKDWNTKVSAITAFKPAVNQQAINNLQTLRDIANDPEGQQVFAVLQAKDVDTVIQRTAKAVGQLINTGVGIGHFGHVNIDVDDLVRNLNLNDRQKLLATRALNAISEETVANLSLNRDAIGGRLTNYEDQQLSRAIASMDNMPHAIDYWARKRILQHNNEQNIYNIYNSYLKQKPDAVKKPQMFFQDPSSGYDSQIDMYGKQLRGLDKLLLKQR
jgi:hypothetical protein